MGAGSTRLEDLMIAVTSAKIKVEESKTRKHGRPISYMDAWVCVCVKDSAIKRSLHHITWYERKYLMSYFSILGQQIQSPACVFTVTSFFWSPKVTNLLSKSLQGFSMDFWYWSSSCSLRGIWESSTSLSAFVRKWEGPVNSFPDTKRIT